MRVAIVTITNGQNYGNRLQNYALQSVLQMICPNVDTIYHCTERYDVKKKADFLTWSLKEVGKWVLRHKNAFVIDIIRVVKFNSFDLQYIHYVKVPENKLINQYDFFVSGSDQVWNPLFECNSEFEFLVFADAKKRISYAASFGVEEIPDEFKMQYSKWLGDMEYLSVREYQGARIIESLINRKAYVHVDPTLLLDRGEWEKIEKKPAKLKENEYAVVYILGGQNKSVQSQISAYSGDIKVIYLSEHANRLSEVYGPCEFLWIIHHAVFVMTNSFHGVVFSLIFEKTLYPLMKFSNTSYMNNRFELLSELCEIDLCQVEGVAEINYKNFHLKLEVEKKKAANYLGKVFKNNAN